MIDPILVQCNDIAETALEVDCVVNASNQELTTGGGVSGAIHNRFGEALEEDASKIERVSIGSAVMMDQYCIEKSDHASEMSRSGGVTDEINWHWVKVIHTVAPRVGNPDWKFILERCYTGCLELVKDYNRGGAFTAEGGIRSIAFPMLGTGAYGLPHEDADAICFNTIVDWLEYNMPEGGLDVRLVIGPYAQSAGDRAVAMAARVTRHLHNKKISAGIS